MNIAIVHFHLNRGGVTQVVLNHLQALDLIETSEPIRVALLYGGRREGLQDKVLAGLEHVIVTLNEIPSLDYDEGRSAQPEQLFGQLQESLNSLHFSPTDSLIQIHNHALGKNISMPGAVARLTLAGFPVLLQIHDFAEDFRPDNYRRLASALTPDDVTRLPSMLYPQADSIHYAVLNGRDHAVLHRAGVPDANLHLLPNAVGEFGSLPSRAEARAKLDQRFGVAADAKYVLYPVRGIRRKNVGEAILWSVLGDEKIVVGVTLAPINPLERKSYDRWKQVAQQEQLPCVFESGGPEGLEFKENLAAADMILTTSVAEGFGMVFLESWLAGRPMIGRDLPEITADFKNAGINLDRLRAQLLVPVDWLGEAQIRSAIEGAFLEAQRGYGLGEGLSDERDQQINELIQDGSVDFAVLSSELQIQLIKTVHGDARRREQLLEWNPWISDSLVSDQFNADVIQSNAARVREEYSLRVEGRRLLDLYSAVLRSPRDGQITAPTDGAAILNSFLDPSRLHPIRLES